MLSKYNGGNQFKYDTTIERVYMSLKELIMKYGADKVYPVHAFFVNTKSLFGNAPVAYSNEYIVNLPQHLLEVTQDMANDEMMVQAINDRRIGFKIRPYDYNGQTNYSVEWVEI